MQKLGYLASILLLTAVIVGPVGLSHAAPVDTALAAKGNQEKGLQAFYQMKDDRFMAEKQRAADVKAKMEAMKKAAQKDTDAMIAARADAIKKGDLPTAADILAKLRADAKATGNAFKNSGAGHYRDSTSKSQIDLEQQRKAFAENVKSQKEMIASSAAKDVKATLDEGRKVPKVQKELTADEQKAQDDAQKAEAKKAAEVQKEKYGGIHYNRK